MYRSRHIFFQYMQSCIWDQSLGIKTTDQEGAATVNWMTQKACGTCDTFADTVSIQIIPWEYKTDFVIYRRTVHLSGLCLFYCVLQSICGCGVRGFGFALIGAILQ